MDLKDASCSDMVRELDRRGQRVMLAAMRREVLEEFIETSRIFGESIAWMSCPISCIVEFWDDKYIGVDQQIEVFRDLVKESLQKEGSR